MNDVDIRTGRVLHGRADRGAFGWARAPLAILRFARRKPLGFAGLVVILVFIVAAVFASSVAPYGYASQDFSARLKGPSSAHLLGTDNLGRDLFSRIIYGGRVSMGVGFGSVFLAQVVGVLLALTSYYGGKLDIIVQRFIDIWLAFPGLILAVTILGVLGSGVTALLFTVAILTTAVSCRLFRSAIIGIRRNVYVDAARTIGASDLRIAIRYVVPNLMPLIIWSASVTLGTVVLLEASLGFLGYGVPPPSPEWGQMLSGAGQQFMRRAPGLAIWPGLAITLTVFSFNVLGDALRDVLDPRLRKG
jgi:peptide/nickel transport system permease protein